MTDLKISAFDFETLVEFSPFTNFHDSKLIFITILPIITPVLNVNVEFECLNKTFKRWRKIPEPPTFYFAENPFVCNCHLQWFKHLQNWQNTGSAEGHLLQQYPVVADMDQVRCLYFNWVSNQSTYIPEAIHTRPTYQTYIPDLQTYQTYIPDLHTIDLHTRGQSYKCYTSLRWYITFLSLAVKLLTFNMTPILTYYLRVSKRVASVHRHTRRTLTLISYHKKWTIWR